MGLENNILGFESNLPANPATIVAAKKVIIPNAI